MKKLFLALFSIALITSYSCKKKTCDLTQSSVVATASEITTIQNYLTTNSLTATQHSDGFFYSITKAGSGLAPDLCSSITLKYKGTLLNGNVFDQSTSNITFLLKDLIVGWQKGLPLIQKGGSIRLYIPPSMGYGSNTSSGLPANSTLIFDIDLVGVEN